MRVLVVAYCFGAWNGQALIGVYKRGLRVGLALEATGHQVMVFCTGREAYEDELTREAERRLSFLDIPFAVESGEAADEVRGGFLAAMREAAPDLVIVGEAPLAGAMLEATLCAVELGLPLVILDNAYRPDLVELFCARFGGMADRIVLSGPASFQTGRPPEFLCQTPAFVQLPEVGSDEAVTVEELAGVAERMVVVLAYDDKARRLGISLLVRLADDGCRFVFLSRDAAVTGEELAGLPDERRKQAVVAEIPADEVLFGMIRRADLAVCKYGFMQVSECLSLQTPTIAAYHEGPRWMEELPEECRALTHATAGAEADEETVAAARRLLATPKEQLEQLHRGGYDAAGQVAGTLERTGGRRREIAVAEVLAGVGLADEALQAAVRRKLGSGAKVASLRAMPIRTRSEWETFVLICEAVEGEQRNWLRLWATTYRSRWGAIRGVWERKWDGRREVLYSSWRERIVIELERGAALLPPI